MKDILSASTGQKAKRAAFRVPNSPAWDQVKLDKMKSIIDMKFNQNHILRTEILKTGEVNLIEATIDTFWGAGRYEVRRSIPPPQAQAKGISGHLNGYSNAPPGTQAMNQLVSDPVYNNTHSVPGYVAQPGALQSEVFCHSAATSSPGIDNFALPSSQVYSTQYIPTRIQNDETWRLIIPLLRVIFIFYLT